MSPEAEVRVTPDAVLADVNSRTLVALDRALPRSGADFLSIAVWDDERGLRQAACMETRLREALCKLIRIVLDRIGKSWRSYTIAADCEVVIGDFGPFDSWLALPELLHVGLLIVDTVEDNSLLRRGGLACHQRYEPALAINSGTFAYADLYREYVLLLRAGHAGQGLDLFGLRPPTPARAAPPRPRRPALCRRGHGDVC